MSEYEAREALKQLLHNYQPRVEVRHGLLGDSNGTVMVPDMPGWAFVRYRDDLNRLSIVRYLLQEQLPDDCPVKVGRKYPSDPFEQVLGEDWDLYAYTPTQSTVDQHGTQVITLADMAMGRVTPTDPVSLAVDVRGFLYVNGTEAVEYGGGTIDLTADVPGAAGHWLVLVYMDLDHDELASRTGTLVATTIDALAPDVPLNALPLAVVDLANGDTTITGDDITQFKAPYASTLGLEQILETIVTFDGEVMVHEGDVVWAT